MNLFVKPKVLGLSLKCATIFGCTQTFSVHMVSISLLLIAFSNLDFQTFSGHIVSISLFLVAFSNLLPPIISTYLAFEMKT